MLEFFTVLTTLAALGTASPIEQRANAQFTVPQVSTGNTNVAAPPLALLKAITKYNGTAPAVVEKAATSAQQNGTVTAASYNVRSSQILGLDKE